ncbi:integrin alpha-PS1 [Anopheles ziemanni]|uniref:integrin alpha-PS1 n=1 Tax=Anopheles ziemanni TaxID=345580 RepID=UPI00265E131E|nr:integrin alpha-PS1 [Anopheles ziemanni]
MTVATVGGTMLCLGVILVVVGSVCSFNLETSHLLDKHGIPGSYFGYSVAGHSQRISKGGGNVTSWILVGAPLGQNLQPASNFSGALFRCPITIGQDDCTQVVTDGLRTPTGNYENPQELHQRLEPPGADEIKSNQWLGVTVETGGQQNKIFVCAHRYIKITKPQTNASADASPGLYLGQGICYVLNEDFSFSFAVEVCRGRSIDREHQQYAFCQSGTSGAVLPDGTALIGTPGAMTWKGTLFNVAIEGDFLSRDKYQYFAPHDNVHSPVPNYSYLGMSVTGGRYFGEYMSYAGGAPRSAEGNGEVVIFSQRGRKNPFDHIISLRGEQFGSGFGSALVTADVNGDGHLDLLVGAPNFFNRTDGGAVYVYLNRGASFNAKYDQRLTGRLESRFGTAIANCGDLNHDGLDDIAIGAPYESDGSGRVYVYFGTQGGALSPEPVQVLDPVELFPQRPGKFRTFGSSLAGGHDLDGNSYPDLIIGSYASDRVTALLARPIINIRTYEELSLDQQQQGGLGSIDPTKFGCSADTTTNATCFTFRACSAVDDASLALNEGDPLADTSLQLRLSINAETFLNDRKFSRVYFGSPTAAGSSEAVPPASNVPRTNVFQRRFRLPVNGKPYCHPVTAYLKEGTRDIQNPIQFRISYTLDEGKESDKDGAPRRGRTAGRRDSAVLPRLEPILNRTAAERTFSVPFQKDCGSDGICQSALAIQSAQLTGLMSKGRAGEYLLVLGRDRTLTLSLTVQNLADSAYETHLYVQHDASLTYAGSKGSSVCGAHNLTVVDCSIGNPVKRQGEVQLALRFDARSLEEYGYSRSAVADSSQVLSLAVFVNTTSRDSGTKTNATLSMRIRRMAKLSISGVAHPEQVFYGGGGSAILGESAIQTLDEIGMPVRHVYQIYNDGPWRAPFVKLMIDWPLQVANNKPQGKWLLYLDALPMLEMSSNGITGAPGPASYCEVQRKSTSAGGAVVIGVNGEPEASPVNPLQLREKGGGVAGSNRVATAGFLRSSFNGTQQQGARTMRVRRDRAMVLRPSPVDGTVQMDCPSQTAKCVRIVCDIHDLGPKAQALVTITARLWNATLVGDYSLVDVVRIGSSAHFTVEGLDAGDEDPSAAPPTLTVRTEAFPEMGPPIVAKDVPWWIIVVAIAAGILVLGGVTYLLSRCGFFRRKRHTGEDPTLSGNLERRRGPGGGGSGNGGDAYDALSESNGGNSSTAERKPFIGRRT